MGRLNRIWFRKDIGWWMVTFGGEKVRLAQGRGNRKLADQKFHELAALRHTAPESPAARVADIIEKFLACNRPHLSAETMRNYDWYGQAFAEHSGYLLASDVKAHHVTDFVSKEGWGETTQYNARRSLFRIFHWAEEEGLLPQNPLKGMKRGNPTPRNRAMKESEFRSLLKGDRPFSILEIVPCVTARRLASCGPVSRFSLRCARRVSLHKNRKCSQSLRLQWRFISDDLFKHQR